jgi:cation transport ATPase
MQSPLLHTADVGISVFTGVDVAKEAADIILLNNFLYDLSR